MKAVTKAIERTGKTITAVVEAPAEWYDLLKRGHCLPLHLGPFNPQKGETLEVVVHEQKA